MASKTKFGRLISNNIFAKYFILFASIFLFVLTILGTTLTILVDAYTQKENTRLLEENTYYIATSIRTTLIAQDMNNRYSVEKDVLCESLKAISNTIDADVFVCDVEGNVIMCKERAGLLPFLGRIPDCEFHSDNLIGDNLLKSVYEGGYVGKDSIGDQEFYIVGCPVYSTDIISGKDQIIGSVFAVTEATADRLTINVLRMFIVSAVACLLIGFICIWLLTKKFVKPLKQMSTAAKKFAIGDFSYRVTINSDDELGKLGSAFNEMANSLDTLESSRRSFVSNVSHELRTPMTSIGGFIDGILDGTIPKDKADYYLNIVSCEIKRLSRLVIAMLNMSRIESGSFEMKPSNYDITDQIIHILLTFEQKIEEKNIQIRGLEELNPVYIVADTDMIYQVIYNIFDNAVKFTNDGGYISVNMIESNDDIEVHIKNSGIGIDNEELSKVFERFYKVDKSRSLDAKGAGLGLYIVKMMVDMHSGSIWARSDDESSAEFVFRLPKSYRPLNKKEKKQ